MRKRPSAPPTYLTKQGSIWSFQIRVPLDVQAEVGRKIVRQSLGTSDVNVARRSAQPLIDAWMRRFQDIRNGSGSRAAAIETLSEIGYNFLGGIDSEGEVIPPHSLDEVKKFAPKIVEIERDSAESKIAYQREKLARILPGIDHHYALAPIRGEVAARLDAVERAVSAITGEAPSQGSSELATIESAYNLWEIETNPAKTSVNDAKLAVKIFSDLFGSLPLSNITRQHAAEFLRALKDLPKNLSPAERKLNVRVVLEKYKDDDSRRPDLATSNKKFGLVRAIINRSIKAGLIEKNPFDGVQIDVVKKKAPRVPFDNGDIRKLFATLSEQSPSIQLIAKLGLTTGARLADMVQLRCNDVLADGKITYISIRNDDDEHGSRSTKNPNSVRRVPLRSEIALILRNHIEGREGLVFPELESKTAGASNIASKKMMRWIRMSGVTDKRKTFHSFRHYFIDLCREHGTPEEVRNALTGHAGGDHVGRKYGNGVPLRVMADAIDKLEFPVALG